jgi:thymidine phosphorylase
VGIVVRCKIGDRLERGEPIGTVHARDTDAAVTAVARVQAALEMGDAPVTVPPLVHGWIE